MSVPTNGTYKILSLLTGAPPASITLNNPAYQPVRLSQSVQIWTLQDGQLSIGTTTIGTSYAYTGVYSGQVMATNDKTQAVTWCMTPYSGQSGTYTIQAGSGNAKGSVWTVTDQPTVGPNIQVQQISTGTEPLQTQLFVLESVPQ